MADTFYSIQADQTLFPWCLMFCLINLPYEVLSNIADSLSFDDVFSLGQTCKDFQFLLTEERICKSFVQNKIKYSNEALAAVKSGGGNARALRRVAKRRDALATANPFVVGIIGFCDAYIYSKGILCYTLDDRLRILDLHRSGQDEVVVSIPALLTQALSEIGDNDKGTFRCLYYADGIVSCLYDASDDDSPAWLIAFHIRSRTILVTHELESTDRIFVRHNRQYLYYGTHSEVGTDGYKKWVIYGYEYRTRKWFDRKVHLPDMVGSEIGSTICFEFYNGFFYALSNQTSFEVEEIDWTSFYHCIRFPLNSPCNALLEKTENKSMWRRQHQEGPIDDRWTSLRLDEDEGTGELRIVEARKEWYLGSSKSQRTYYTTDIIFPEPLKDEVDLSILPTATSQEHNFVPLSTSSWVAAASSSEGSGSTTAFSSTMASTSIASSSTAPASTAALEPDETDISAFPNVPLIKLLRKDDHPHYINALDRRPERTHPGNDGSQKPTHTLAKSRIRTYHTSCNTFLDLVDDPLPDDWQGKQRLRLRVGSRKLGPPLVNSHGLIRGPDPDLKVALDEMYRESPITYWPPAQNPLQPDEHVNALYNLMNPPTHLGNVEGTADERSLVYVTGGGEGPQAIIFVGFDPAMKLVGIKQWGGLAKKGVGEGPHINGRATGCMQPGFAEDEEGIERYVDVGEVDRTVGIDRKGKGKAGAVESYYGGSMMQVGAVSSTADGPESTGGSAGTRGGIGRSSSGWAWRERAMYQDIGLGFYFGRDRPQKQE